MSRLGTLIVIGLVVCYGLEWINWGVIITTNIVLLVVAYRMSVVDTERSNEGNSTLGGFLIPILLVGIVIVLSVWYSTVGHQRYNTNLKRSYYHYPY